MKKKLAAQGVLPIASTPDEFTGVIKAEQEKWAEVIKAANIKEYARGAQRLKDFFTARRRFGLSDFDRLLGRAAAIDIA